MAARYRRRAKSPSSPGFQGVAPDGRVTTLGRGGSDTSAVALAAALKADRCDIYTDVDGVYTTDPRIVAEGAQARPGHLRGNARDGVARRQGAADPLGRAGDEASVRVQVLSSFDDAPGSDLPGTLVVDEEEIMEDRKSS